MLRIAAFALNAHQVRDLCAGDGTLAFGAGLSSPDEPDLLLADFTGRARLWIELGQPDEKPLAVSLREINEGLLSLEANPEA